MAALLGVLALCLGLVGVHGQGECLGWGEGGGQGGQGRE